MASLCRDCGWLEAAAAGALRCAACAGPRLRHHPELETLTIAHIDCDAFYATIEKRDDPSLRDRPVIVGGGHRGVVSAACYIARLYGVRSAMPMFKALKACPDAVVRPPNMAKYREVGAQVRALMGSVTPLVEPLSIDEAFLDLAGTQAINGGPPARTLAGLARKIERELGITVSIGLSYNKFLAKIASDLDKPRGFAIIGRAEAREFLSRRSVGLIWGVGQALQQRLAGDGIRLIGDLLRFDERDLTARYGAIGRRLYRFARGEDDRTVDPDAPTKSISAETTFDQDLDHLEQLLAELWPLAETVSRRSKRAHLAGDTVTLKLKTADFKTISRSRQLGRPTQLAEILYRSALPLVEKEADGRRFRLIGIGLAHLVDDRGADPPELFDQVSADQARIEHAIDAVRERLGRDAITRGRGFVPTPPPRKRH